MDNSTFLAAVTLLVMLGSALLYSVMVCFIEKQNPRRVPRRHPIPPVMTGKNSETSPIR